MSQNLAMPLNTSNVTVCYKNEAPNYINLGAGPIHYGVDFTGSSGTKEANGFFASGNGVVLGINTVATQTVGRWVAIMYTDVSGYGNVVVRYFHLDTIFVSVGNSVTLNTKIGTYGNTGPYSQGKHLHVEVDVDTTSWNYTPTISVASGNLRAGTRDTATTTDTSTCNPLDVFKRKLSAPENQTCTIYYDANYRTRTAGTGSFY